MYNLAMHELRDLPSGSRVLMLWETRSYYCAPVCRPDETIDRWLDDLSKVNAPDALPAYWRTQGYTHVLFHRAGAEFIRTADSRYQDADWETLDDVLASLAVETDLNQVYTLYRLDQ
jgi:hypothetical protein